MNDLAIKEIMTVDLVTLNTNECVSKVAQIFKEQSFHHIPVVNEDNCLEGIISQSDFERIKTGATHFRNPKIEEYNQSIFQSMLAKDIMTKDVIALRSTDSIRKAYEIFKQHRFRAIPVIDKAVLIGIVTPSDLLDYFFNKKN